MSAQSRHDDRADPAEQEARERLEDEHAEVRLEEDATDREEDKWAS